MSPQRCYYQSSSFARRSAAASVLLFVSQLGVLTNGELIVSAPCPASLPRLACFSHRRAPTSPHALQSVALPLAATVKYARTLLQMAIEVEHSTIPLYLTTQYSLVNQSSYHAMTLRSVVVEEMLHMVNAANVLNAIGGAPFIDKPSFIPTYPLVVPLINMTADVVWFTRQSIEHYEILESTPPSGYNASISAAYLQIISVLTALVAQHGEGAVFTGNASYQVGASTSYGQMAVEVTSLADARTALIGVAEQGGGCPVAGHSWPKTVNISAGPLGGGVSHAARYTELLIGRAYAPNDEVGKPTGPSIGPPPKSSMLRRFTPNPTTEVQLLPTYL